jgi:hypothetical protein
MHDEEQTPKAIREVVEESINVGVEVAVRTSRELMPALGCLREEALNRPARIQFAIGGYPNVEVLAVDTLGVRFRLVGAGLADPDRFAPWTAIASVMWS